MKALSVATAYLPAGRSLDEARAKLRALEAELRKQEKSGNFQSVMDYIERSYRLQAQTYDDAKTLGLAPCLGRPPRPPIGG